jgi:hypothetical protein
VCSTRRAETRETFGDRVATNLLTPPHEDIRSFFFLGFAFSLLTLLPRLSISRSKGLPRVAPPPPSPFGSAPLSDRPRGLPLSLPVSLSTRLPLYPSPPLSELSTSKQLAHCSPWPLCSSPPAYPIPMADPTDRMSPLSGVRALLFDVFGTVVDWQGSVLRQLEERVQEDGLGTSLLFDRAE